MSLPAAVGLQVRQAAAGDDVKNSQRRKIAKQQGSQFACWQFKFQDAKLMIYETIRARIVRGLDFVDSLRCIDSDGIWKNVPPNNLAALHRLVSEPSGACHLSSRT